MTINIENTMIVTLTGMPLRSVFLPPHQNNLPPQKEDGCLSHLPEMVGPISNPRPLLNAAPKAERLEEANYVPDPPSLRAHRRFRPAELQRHNDPRKLDIKGESLHRISYLTRSMDFDGLCSDHRNSLAERTNLMNERSPSRQTVRLTVPGATPPL